MSPESIPDEDLDKILAAGIRVPDHGALNPWKICVIKGDKLKQVEEIAKKKMSDLNAHDLTEASKIIAGSARSMGIEVKE